MEREREMGVFDQIRKGVQVVSDKSDELVESTKIKMTISKIESQVNQKKVELGALTYRLYTEGRIDVPEIVTLCTGIDNCHREIMDLQKQIALLQPSPVVCPACSTRNAPGAMFCTGCGASLQAAQAQGAICPSCTASNRLGAKFCVKCGTVMSPSAEAEAAATEE